MEIKLFLKEKILKLITLNKNKTMEKKKEKKTEKEICRRCGIETSYDIDTHVDMRTCYVEGVGQLCSKCYDIVYEGIK